MSSGGQRGPSHPFCPRLPGPLESPGAPAWDWPAASSQPPGGSSGWHIRRPPQRLCPWEGGSACGTRAKEAISGSAGDVQAGTSVTKGGSQSEVRGDGIQGFGGPVLGRQPGRWQAQRGRGGCGRSRSLHGPLLPRLRGGLQVGGQSGAQPAPTRPGCTRFQENVPVLTSPRQPGPRLRSAAQSEGR